ncbi:uncharacterized protein SRS1_14960 [Sporisorium reilianum f. sp. reilianum]|uniref:Translation initiation factor 3 N-terminal domain-containing protein n=1 Tax=Sporisorium reilianum f. sp. reilianum TaxID=72559 RepID=A0A2N8UHX7_9BASI|nr:uncharacterized protein SRS1_14960 [Sporisorium reilianum f. sp. reilianum]
MRPPHHPVGALRAAFRGNAAARLSTAAAPARLVASQPHTRPFCTTLPFSASSSTSSSSNRTSPSSNRSSPSSNRSPTSSDRTSPSTSASKDAPPTPKGPPRDEAIIRISEYVRLVDPKTGSLAGPFNTRQILAKLDRTKFYLQQAVPAQPSRATVAYDPASPPASVDPAVLVQFAICRLVDKKEEFDRARNLKRKPDSAPAASSSSKEVQLTWSVTPNDLAHKLGKAKKEMLRGARINVVVTTKPGGRKYVKGLNAKEDEKREQMLLQIERLLCVEKTEGAEEKEVVARRLQDIDWQRGGSAAVMSFEAFRR